MSIYLYRSQDMDSPLCIRQLLADCSSVPASLSVCPTPTAPFRRSGRAAAQSLPPVQTVELDLFSWRRVGELVPRSCDVPSTLARVSRAASRVRRERGGERRGRRRKVCDARLGEGQNAQLAGEDGGG